MSFCSALVRAAEDRLTRLPLDQPFVHPFVQAWRQTRVCLAARDEAWGLSLDSIEAGPRELSARWSLRHMHAGGDGAFYEDAPFAPETMPTETGASADGESPARGLNLVWSDARRIIPTGPTTFDFDSDGMAEAVVIVETTETSEAGRTSTTRRGRVWAAARGGAGGDGAIELYRPAREIVFDDARDVDGDGRPDLVTRGPYAAIATATCGGEDRYPVVGPPLLAHALPAGGFSWTDAAAATFARRGCDAPPRSPLVHEPVGAKGSGAIDLASSARNVACARLWDAGTAKLVSAIRSACRPRLNAACAPCDDAALLERWARVPPPLSLSPAVSRAPGPPERPRVR